MKTSARSVVLGGVAVLSWSTVATAFKVALRNMTVFEMLIVACATALLIFTLWIFATGSWRELRSLTPTLWGRFGILLCALHCLRLSAGTDGSAHQLSLAYRPCRAPCSVCPSSDTAFQISWDVCVATWCGTHIIGRKRDQRQCVGIRNRAGIR